MDAATNSRSCEPQHCLDHCTDSLYPRQTMPFFNFDIPCPSCGYNLRGLSLESGCPECGLKAVSPVWTADETDRIRRLDAEIAENLQQQEQQAAREQRIDQLLAAWEKRGERFDHLLDRIDEILRRVGKDP